MDGATVGGGVVDDAGGDGVDDGDVLGGGEDDAEGDGVDDGDVEGDGGGVVGDGVEETPVR
jgi:hypothetical protein